MQSLLVPNNRLWLLLAQLCSLIQYLLAKITSSLEMSISNITVIKNDKCISKANGKLKTWILKALLEEI
jgi:hypothetical protein